MHYPPCITLIRFHPYQFCLGEGQISRKRLYLLRPLHCGCIRNTDAQSTCVMRRYRVIVILANDPQFVLRRTGTAATIGLSEGVSLRSIWNRNYSDNFESTYFKTAIKHREMKCGIRFVVRWKYKKLQKSISRNKSIRDRTEFRSIGPITGTLHVFSTHARILSNVNPFTNDDENFLDLKSCSTLKWNPSKHDDIKWCFNDASMTFQYQ